MKVLIGTKNPGKIEGARTALEKHFDNVDIMGVSVPSQVPDQPVGIETYLGAKNRVKGLVKYAKENDIDADLYMAIESGMVNELGEWAITNIAVIEDRNGNKSFGTSASFPVPDKYVEEIKSIGLGDVMDKINNQSNLHSGKGGVGILTHDVITRIDLNFQAFTMALTKYVNGTLWTDAKENQFIVK